MGLFDCFSDNQNLPSVYIKSMEEEDQAQNDESNAGEADAEVKSSRGKTGGSDTQRTDKSEFLDAPEGGLDQKHSAEDRIVKIDLPEGEGGSSFGSKKRVPKKKVTNAAKTNGTKKATGKESPPKNATVQAVGVYAVKKPGSKDDPQQKQTNKEVPKGGANNKSKTNKKDDLPAKKEPTENNGVVQEEAAVEKSEDAPPKNENEHGNDNTGDSGDVEEAQVKENFENEACKDENISHIQNKSTDPAETKIQPSTSKKPHAVKPAPGLYDKTREEDVIHRAKLRTSYVAPKPKVKPQPNVPVEEEEIAKQALMERRKSQRFIGLDPEKVAKAKSNPPKPIQEENPPPPKPKTERFVGLKIKQGGKSPRKEVDRSNENNLNEEDLNQDVPIEINVQTSGDRMADQDSSEGRLNWY